MKTRNIIYLLVIFACGLLIGATLMDLAEHNWLHKIPRSEVDIRQHRRIAREMAKRLDLNPAQQAAVDRILRHTVHAYLLIEKQVSPQFAAVRERGRQQIRAILTPAQRMQFDQMVAQIDQREPSIERSPAIPQTIPMQPARNVSH